MSRAVQDMKDLNTHYSVLLQETVSMLQPKPGGRYLDGTVGLGGHAFAILKAAGNDAKLCGLDQDKDALRIARVKLKPFGNNVHLIHTQYSRFALILEELGWDYLDGAVLDVGISSLQIDTSNRGFSFLSDGPLDMRMDQSSKALSALELINKSKEQALQKIIAQYGEEPQAYKIAKAIVTARKSKSIETTKELASIIEKAYPAQWRYTARNHPATRTFQAIRIAVNNELDELHHFFSTILSYIIPGGRIAVISFHSLEDRIVKQYMKAWSQSCICPVSIPVCVCNHKQEAKILTKKPIIPTETEVLENTRSRSAKLRVAEKCIPDEVEEISSKERYEQKRLKKFINEL